VGDTAEFWAHHRGRVAGGEPGEPVVIVGASRAQVGLDPAVLGEALGADRVVQLTIDGSTPLEVVRDLSQDQRFRGTVLCSTTAEVLLRERDPDTRRDLEYLASYHQQRRSPGRLDEHLESVLTARLQSRMVSFSPQLSVRPIVSARLSPRPMYVHMGYDRYRPAAYRERMTADERSANRARRIDRRRERLDAGDFQPADLERLAREELQPMAAALRERGGELILVRLPTTDEHLLMDEVQTPRAEYWDRITPWTGIATVHFLDHASLSDYDCPDTSHIDESDSEAFSRALGDIVADLSGDPGG